MMFQVYFRKIHQIPIEKNVGNDPSNKAYIAKKKFWVAHLYLKIGRKVTIDFMSL
jgi:hypothetical protein